MWVPSLARGPGAQGLGKRAHVPMTVRLWLARATRRLPPQPLWSFGV